MSAAEDIEEPAEAVAPLVRGLAVLRALTAAEHTPTLGDLQRATGLARATVDRLVATLAQMGFVRLEGRTVTLAPALMALGNAYLAATGLPGRLGDYMRALADEVDESVSLAVGDGDGIRFVYQVTRRRAMSVTFRLGDLLPAERTAAGTVIAASWTDEDWTRWRARRAADPDDRGFPPMAPRTGGDLDFDERARFARAHGWSLDDQLIEPGLLAVAVPVRYPSGETACAASVVSHSSRHSTASMERELLPRLCAAVAEMEAALVGRIAPAPAPHALGLAAWTGTTKQELGRGFVESLARGLTVLTAFGDGRAELPLTAVAATTGLARATARRALITLEHLGYVTTDGRRFSLTPRVLGLGFPPLSRTTLPVIAAPHLKALAERVRDSSSLAVLSGAEVRYTARASVSRIMSVEIAVGTRLPAHATAMGRALLAHLPVDEYRARLAAAPPAALTPHTITDPERLDAVLDAVARDGYALVDAELEVGLRSVAVPVRDRAGKVVAAVNVASHSGGRTPAEFLAEVLPHLRETAARIEADLHVTSRFTAVHHN
ncbi:IclR family pca regulon transcriptional regulator [Actinokineospora auranticolor]|uniref:Glycerol operon regulatory protein n=1 Tax=Actinokineospora auranticolor TaxID=155976 RepID=A0A2S6H1M4_9PSEU|nr:IclR family pca regulon transcriptional regulator [Actinokineospora auranticolor]